MANQDEIRDRIALVSGAASGLGRSTALSLARRGARVALLDLNEEAGYAVAKEIGGLFVRCDVTGAGDWDRAIGTVEAELGTPTLVHLNAGLMTRPPSASLSDDPFDWIDKGGYRRICSVNMDGVVFGLRSTLPCLRREGGGSIVATASIAGLIGIPFDPFYAMTKHAVVGLVRSLGPLLAPEGIRIKALCPGGFDTPLIPDEMRAQAAAGGGEGMGPDEVAEVVVDLLAGPGTGEAWIKVGTGSPATLYSATEVPFG